MMMNSQENTKKSTIAEKVTHFTEEKASSLGETLESVNEKAADLKQRAEIGYSETVSPAIDSAQIEVAGATRYLQESSANDYLRDLENFAKRHPRITAALSVVVGWKLGRALKFSK